MAAGGSEQRPFGWGPEGTAEGDLTSCVSVPNAACEGGHSSVSLEANEKPGAERLRQGEGGREMAPLAIIRRFMWLAAVTLGLVFIGAGAYMVSEGLSAKDQVHDTLVAERITTAEDASIPNAAVEDAATGEGQACGGRGWCPPGRRGGAKNALSIRRRSPGGLCPGRSPARRE